jgi:hypothetical protein
VSNPRVRELAVNPAVVAEVFAEGEAAIVRELDALNEGQRAKSKSGNGDEGGESE